MTDVRGHGTPKWYHHETFGRLRPSHLIEIVFQRVLATRNHIIQGKSLCA